MEERKAGSGGRAGLFKAKEQEGLKAIVVRRSLIVFNDTRHLDGESGAEGGARALGM